MGGGGGGSIPNADLKQLEGKAKQALKSEGETGCHVFISFHCCPINFHENTRAA